MKKTLTSLFGFLLLLLFLPFKGLVEAKQKRLKEAYKVDASSITDQEAHLILKDIAWEQYSTGNYSKAEEYSHEFLRLNEIVDENWNYGNAIHHSHTILGLIAVQMGDIDSAKEHLALSAKTPSSPQLNTFGPSLALADKLLKIGETKSVKKFLLNCRNFWGMDKGKISEWIENIEAGNQPCLCTQKRT